MDEHKYGDRASPFDDDDAYVTVDEICLQLGEELRDLLTRNAPSTGTADKPCWQVAQLKGFLELRKGDGGCP